MAYEHEDGPRNQICLARMGMNTWVRSWVPDYSIHGMVVRHGEAFTISDKLTVWEETARRSIGPRCTTPTAPATRPSLSLNETARLRLRLQPRTSAS